MSFGIDPIAFIISLLAFWISWNEVRRNNIVQLKILSCESGGTQSDKENNTEDFIYIKLRIQNSGITLWNPQVSLYYTAADGFATAQLPLNRWINRTGDVTQFARGMIAEFGLKSYEMDKNDPNPFFDLNNLPDQKARYLVFSQNFVAKEFYIGRFRDRLSIRWNSFARRINSKCDRHIAGNRLIQGHLLKADHLELSSKLMWFIDTLSRESSR